VIANHRDLVRVRVEHVLVRDQMDPPGVRPATRFMRGNGRSSAVVLAQAGAVAAVAAANSWYRYENNGCRSRRDSHDTTLLVILAHVKPSRCGSAARAALREQDKLGRTAFAVFAHGIQQLPERAALVQSTPGAWPWVVQ